MSFRGLKFARGLLAIKFLMVVVPVFLLCTSLGLFIIADRNAKQADREMIARLGSEVASIAATVERFQGTGDTQASQSLIDMLLADRAIECVELRTAIDKPPSLTAPHKLGCKGVEHYNHFEIGIGETGEASLLGSLQ